MIGTGNQGFNDINSFLHDERVQIVAVCDVNRESAGYWEGKIGGREPARRLVEEHYAKNRPSGTYRGCDALADFREILGRNDIDAVEICTPDHWHAIMVIAACKAGKDIYCQKPLSLTIAEGRAMSYAVKQVEGRVPDRQPAALGRDVSAAPASWCATAGSASCRRSASACPAAAPTTPRRATTRSPSRCPKGFDYDFWLGPAPERLMPRRGATSTSAGSTITPAAR